MSQPDLVTFTPGRRVRVTHLQAAKDRGERWAMLTSYDQYSAAVFERAGVPVLLVGDSAGNNVLGYPGTVPVTVEEMVMLTAAVVRATSWALVVADLPFGSYEGGAAQALGTAARLLKQGGAQAVKLEGGRRVAATVGALVDAGVPVMGHLGFTPQSEHRIGGYRVQGRGAQAEEVVADALALQAAGAFAVVLELVPAQLAKRVTAELTIPTVGIGAGGDCDAQVLVWQDMAGLNPGPVPRFVRRYADLHGELERAARAYATDVREGRYPAAEHGYE